MSLTVQGPGLSLAGVRASESAFELGISRLSSGLRIQQAADDAAGLAISERMRSQVTGSAMATRNVHDGINLLQVAEDGLSAITSMLQRARELAVQAASTGTMTQGDRDAAAAEVRQLVTEIDRTAVATSYNGQHLIDGSRAGGFTFQVGANRSETLSTGTTDVRADTLGLRGLAATGALSSPGTPTTYQVRSKAFASWDAGASNNANKLDVSLDGGTTFTEISVARRNYAQTDHALLRSQLTAGLTALGVSVTLTGEGTAAAQLEFFAAGGDTVHLVFDGKGAKDRWGLGIETDVTQGTPGAFSAGSAGTSALVDLVASGSAEAIALCDTALSTVVEQRTQTGALQNRLGHRLSVLASTEQNLSAAHSQLADAGMAKEWAGVVRSQVLRDAGLAVQAQAAPAGQRVLQLLTSLR